MVDPGTVGGLNCPGLLINSRAGSLKELATRTRQTPEPDEVMRRKVRHSWRAKNGRAADLKSICSSLAVRGLPSRVGLAFFHRLVGCRVVWTARKNVVCSLPRRPSTVETNCHDQSERENCFNSGKTWRRMSDVRLAS